MGTNAPSDGATTLVGRSFELSRLGSVIDHLGQSGSPAVVDITGEAGIGKSRLLGELGARALRAGLTVLRGRATEYERYMPFQPFRDAFVDVDLSLLDTDPTLAEAAPVLRDICDTQGADSGESAPSRFGRYRAVAKTLARLGTSSGLVIALDDLHWVDSASLELLDHLIRHPVRGPVLLALARRERQTPIQLTAALTRGIDSGAVLRMMLGPLSEGESIRALAPDLPEGKARELHASSEGNPLYFLSLLQAYRHGAPLSGPSGLGSLLLDELTALTGPQRRTVEAVAVLGDHATSAMLSLTSGLATIADLEDCTAELARRDILRREPGGRWTLRHPLLRSLVYDHTTLARRTDIHRRAAGGLARTGASVTERAHHLEKALDGWDEESAVVLAEAATEFAHTAPATAAHLLGVVLQVLPHTPAHARERGELTLARARALGTGGNLRDSRDLLHALIGTIGEDAPALRADAIALCAKMERHLGHSPEAAALLRRELSRTPGPPTDQTVSLGLALGMAALLTVSYPAVRADIERTLAVARSHSDLTGEAGALALASLGEAYEGDTEAACRFADAAAALVDGLTDPNLAELSESLVWLSWAETLLERYANAERHADRGLAIAHRGGRLHVLPHLLSSKAFAHLTTCRLASALEAAEEAESVARAIGSTDLLAFTLSLKALVLLLGRPLGDSKALATAEEAVAAAGRSSHWWGSLAGCMLGHAAYVSGDPHRAQEAILTAGGGPGLRRLQPSIRPGQLETLVSAALATGDPDRAARWAAQAVDEADRIGLPGQRAAALRARATLAEHHGDSGAALRLLEEAAQEYGRCGATVWEVYSLLRAAPLAKAAGRGPGAVAMWRRAHGIAVEGGARLLSDLAELIRPQVEGSARVPEELAQLTVREREIAELVAEGLSNQAIAVKLYVSRRTVESHLSAIYRKADVPSRSALASLMTRAAFDRGA
jgi:DNA-binding CsgD family transcriptional regulator